MVLDEIFRIIQLAHHFHSAYTREQVYQFLGVKLDRILFEQRLNRLLENSCLVEIEGRLYMPRAALDLPQRTRERKNWSRRLYNRYRPHLNRLAAIPWIQFIALTGANSFESCKEEDDIDLFLITDRDRLWLCNVVIGAMRRISRPKALCLNYLIEEDHLHIPTHTHYTAVQIVQMIPIYNSSMKTALMKANPWICEFLPNASVEMSGSNEYTIATYRRRTAIQPLDRVCWGLNQLLFQKRYQALATQQHPIGMGKNVEIGRGIAKLHTRDHSDIYQGISAWPL